MYACMHNQQVPTPDVNTDTYVDNLVYSPLHHPLKQSCYHIWLLPDPAQYNVNALAKGFVFSVLCEYGGKMDSNSHPWIH